VAIYHLHAQIIKRSSGRSSVASSAYRAGEKIRNDYDGVTHDYTRKTGVVYSEIMLPSNAPTAYSDRAILWNAVERIEKRKDSQTAREIEIALPFELDRETQIQLVREYIQENFISAGMCADFAVHDKGDGNPHAHIMLTTREVSEKGFGGKNREWNKPECLEQWRGSWADKCNERLQAKGLDERIDHRTLEAQGIEREPTIHIGVTAKAMAKAGRDSERMKEHKEIKGQNKLPAPASTAEYMHELKQGYFLLDKEIAEIKQQSAEARERVQSLRFRADKIEERVEHILTLRERLSELRAERQCMGYLESKRAIDAQIQRIEQSREQAEKAFQKEHYIIPDEAQVEIQRIAYKAKDLDRVSGRLQERLNPLTAEKDIFMFEYQRQKLLAGISPHEQSIQERLLQLDREELHTLTAQEKIARVRSGRILDRITEHSFQRILDEATPEQAYRLIQLHERERAREHQKIRGR